MPLIETDASNPSAFGMGTLAPHANPKTHRSMWACIEGDNDGRWASVRQAKEGIPVGNDGRMKLPYEELRVGDKGGGYHDVVLGKVKLREMIVPIADAEAKDLYEGALSTREVKRFETNLNEKRESQEGLTKFTSLESTVETH